MEMEYVFFFLIKMVMLDGMMLNLLLLGQLMI